MSAAELILATGTAPPAPAAGRITVYAENDVLYWKNSAGVVSQVASSPGSLVVASGKTLAVNNSLTMAGTDGKSLTLTRSLTVAGQDGLLIFGGSGADALMVPSGGGTAFVLTGEQTVTHRKIFNTGNDTERIIVQTTGMASKQGIKVMTSATNAKALHVTRATVLDTGYICEFSLQDLGRMEWGAGDAAARDTFLYRSGAATLSLDAWLRVTKSAMVNRTNAGYDTSNSAFTLEALDPVMQLIGDDAGQAGQGIIMSGITGAGSGGNKHWLLHAAGPSRGNRFEVRYGTTSDGVNGNIFGGLIGGTLSLCVLTNGEVGIGTTAPAHKLDVSGTCRANTFHVGTNQVVGARATGWAAATGNATRTTFATSTITLVQLAERVKALIDDLTTHGLIGA